MKRPAPEALQLENWPSVDSAALKPEVRRRYRQRAAAVEQFARGLRIEEIERRSGLDRRSLYRSVERAVSAHPDGRMWGFRALIPAIRIKAYVRTKRSKGSGDGLVGAFGQLVGRHLELERLLRRLIQDKTVWLTQRDDRFFVRGLDRAHGEFIRECRNVGLIDSDYPLSQQEQGKRALSRALRERMLSDFGRASKSAGALRVKPASALSMAPAQPVTEPFDTVEFDAHRLDVRLTILDQDPYGQEHVYEIERVWLLAIIDVATRAILGYRLCLRREYSRYDVIGTFECAIAPARRPTLSIPNLEPNPSGGFVSVALPETAYACWRLIRFDNARAHLAADSLDVACEILGCTVDVGPAYEPNDRPFIERFFGTVASQLAHRLPGSTGSKAHDVLRELRKPSGSVRLVVGLDELQELLAVWVWNYNGAPHGGLGGRTPLEAMRAGLREQGAMLRYLPTGLRGSLCLLQNAHRSRVRGDVTRGEKPHISFYHLRYTSAALAQRADLIGRPLRIYYDADDIRRVRAFLDDGTELGELTVGGRWRESAHSLEMRQRIFRARRLRQVQFSELDDPVQVYLQFKRGQAKRSRKAASEVAQIKERIRLAPPDTAKAAPEPSILPLAAEPVAPVKLRIAPGYA